MYLVQKGPFVFALIFFGILMGAQLVSYFIFKSLFIPAGLLLMLFSFAYVVIWKVSLSSHFKGWASIYLAVFTFIISFLNGTFDITCIANDPLLQKVTPIFVKNILWDARQGKVFLNLERCLVIIHHS